MALQTLVTNEQLRECRESWRARGETVAFVPTMGALHEGHLSLIEAAKSRSDKVIVSIFVNPTQFGQNEDFASYPRMFKEDVSRLTAFGVDAVFAPNAANMYPDGFQTFVHNEKMAQVLCGAFRPGHFQGVLTVVIKLFHLIQPDVAVFGKKDYQQFQMIRTMVRDLNMPIEIVGGETIREADGLAMSSRNLMLSAEERRLAPQIYQGLKQAQELFEKGEKQVQLLVETFRQSLDPKAFQLQYAEIRDAEKLELFEGSIDRPAVFAVAAFLGTVRLIDNVELG